MRTSAVCLAALVIAYAPERAHAAAGDVDPTFGDGGMVIDTRFGGAADGVVVQADGRILIANAGDDGGRLAFAVSRFLTTGEIDTSFGVGGSATIAVGEFSYTDTLAVDREGRVLVGGRGVWDTGDGVGSGIAVARFLADGARDPSFGTGGGALHQLPQTAVHGIAIQADGRIVLAGSVGVFDGADSLVARLLPNGDLDTSFGDGGVAIGSDGPGLDEFHAAALDRRGRIFAAGSRTIAGVTSMVVARFLPDGRLDTSFGDEGFASARSGERSEGIALAIQPNGRIVLAGTEGEQAASLTRMEDIALARFHPDGSLDESFGLVLLGFGGSNVAAGVLLQRDGKVVVVGSVDTHVNLTFGIGLFRLLPNGALDSTFGSGGGVFTRFPCLPESCFAKATGAALQPDGNYVVSGLETHPLLMRYVGEGACGSDGAQCVRRYLALRAPARAGSPGGRLPLRSFPALQ